MRPATSNETLQRNNIPLTVEQAADVESVASKCRLLCYVSAEALAKIDRIIDAELKAIGASPDPDTLSKEEKEVALSSAGRFGGQAGIAAAAAFKAKQRADAAVVAGIPRESLVILKIMHGDDTVKLAAAWRAQAVTGARR
jgi:hypothetical protein